MEVGRFPSHGGFSVRSIIGFALTVIITAFLWAILGSTPTQAATTATWSGDDVILFDGHGFNEDAGFNDTTGTIPDGATIYTAPVQTAGTGSTSQKLLVLYFAPGVDPPTANTVSYVEFDYANGTLSNPQAQQTVELAVQGSSDGTGSSCTVGGIGWIICPVSVFLAESMDNIFNFLASLIATQPLMLGDSNNSMYTAWNITRTIANLAFVIVFLIIIYAQLTNLGISNYGLKKLTPRLIVAAVLVNVSYYIAAAAIDLSNIIGYSLQDVFNIIREDVFHITNDNFAGVNNNPWTTVTTVVLAGGGVIGGVYYAAAGGLYFLIPILIGLGLTALFVLVILAARQAIIVILVILAPLAFVANLLPNTEKWFDKWKDLFFTMLIFFPAFALIFGGSQLAGQIIIQNAGDNIVTVLFGMAVQVAPLVITPILLRLSGSLLGKIAQIANNPRKGAMDRSKGWAERRAEHAKQQNIARGPRLRNPASWGSGMVRGLDYRKRRLSDNTDIWKQEATNRYEQTPKYDAINERKNAAELKKEAIHSGHSAHIETLKVRPGSSLYNLASDAQSGKERAEAAQNVTNAHFNQQRTIAGTALNASSNYLEYTKMSLESSESEKTVYQMNQKLTAGTQLNSAVDRLETGKARVERKNSQYTAMVDGMKIDASTGVYSAALGAQSAKELQEAAQNKVQSFFDQQRRTAGTGLNESTIRLEETKLNAESSKSLTTAYIAAEKLAVGSDLHLEVIRSEQAKLATQLGEGRVTRMVEEYKSGQIVRTGELSTLMTTMVDDVENIAAETQGAQAAKNIQTKNIAQAFTAGTPRAEELLRTAQSVDIDGGLRAEATALATLNEITNKARTANESLLEERAVGSNETPKNYALRLLRERLAGDTSQSEDLIRAAMEIAGKEAQIPIIREMRMSGNINQDHLSAMILRNAPTMKAKGGFDLQNDAGLAGASQDIMNASIAGTLGSVASDKFTDLKNGAIIDYANGMETIMDNSEQLMASTAADPATRAKEQKYGRDGIQGIRKTYANLTETLRDPELRNALGDNFGPAIMMHYKIHNDPRFHNAAMEIDYAAIDPLGLSGITY